MIVVLLGSLNCVCVRWPDCKLLSVVIFIRLRMRRRRTQQCWLLPWLLKSKRGSKMCPILFFFTLPLFQCLFFSLVVMFIMFAVVFTAALDRAVASAVGCDAVCWVVAVGAVFVSFRSLLLSLVECYWPALFYFYQVQALSQAAVLAATSASVEQSRIYKYLFVCFLFCCKPN